MRATNRKKLARLLLGVGMASMAAVAWAHPGWHGGPGWCWGYDGGDGGAGWRDAVRQQTADLHDRLKLNADQEKAWKQYQETVTANIRARQEREQVDFSRLSAPERLEKSQQFARERDERMSRHLESFKAFYATLTPEQQEILEKEGVYHPDYGYHHRGPWHRRGLQPR